VSSAALVSVEEYLGHASKPACEYVAGALRPKPMPTKLHALIQYLLVALLRKQGIDALPEVTLRLEERKFLIPDVIAAPFVEEPYPTKPVLLCAEILSPEDRLNVVFAKCEDYHAWGVPFCWIIDPIQRTGWEYHAGHSPTAVTLPGNLRAGNLIVRMDDLFSDQIRQTKTGSQAETPEADRS